MKRILPWLGWSSLVLAGIALAAALVAPTHTAQLDATRINADQGSAFGAQIPTRVGVLYSAYGASADKSASGRMIVAEDGLLLGPAGAAHDFIRASGSGAYLHWDDTLYFSSSDGSDPRSNGRTYTYEVDAALKPKVAHLAIVVGLLGSLCLYLARQGAETAQVAAQSQDTRRSRGVRLVGLAVVAAAAVGTALLVALPRMQQAERIRVNVEAIKPARDLAYYALLPTDRRWPWRRAAPLTAWSVQSTPQLIENGAPIGRPTLSLAEARKGEGRFAYFGDALAFSTSDASDPRTNGRRYELEVRAAPVPTSLLLVASLAAMGGVMMLWGRGRAFVRAVSSFGAVDSNDSKVQLSNLRTLVIDYSVMTLGAFAAIAALVLNWWTGSTSSLGVASFFPVSDAFGYYQCAMSIGILDTLNAPHFGVEWCSRRAVYPATLSSLLALSGWRPSPALLIQAGMIGLAGGILLLALQRTFGWITALLCAVGVAFFAYDFALGNFMTESLGLVAGLCGLSLLLLSVRRHEPIPVLLVCGLGMISVGMAMRAGALFIMPALAAWALYATRRMAWASRWRLLTMAAAGLALGLALQLVVVYSEGSNARNTGGNTALILYGLSTGSRDWSQGYRDFAGDFASTPETIVYEKIRRVALANIGDKPTVFVRSLMAAGGSFGKHLFSFGPLGQYSNVAILAFLLGMIVCLACWRHPACALLLTFALPELASAPLIFDSGGHRIFAVSVAARLAIAAVGVAWILAVAIRLHRPTVDYGIESDLDRRIHLPALGLSAVLVFLAIFALTPLVNPLRLAPVAESTFCSEQELEVVTRLGKESSQLTLSESRLPLGSEALGVPYGRLELEPAPRQAWWLAELKPQPYGTTLIYALQRTGKNAGMIVPAFAQSPIPVNGGVVSLCLAKEAPGTVKLGDFNFLRLVRYQPH